MQQVVIYSRIRETDEIYLDGIYFGGIAEDEKEAEAIARKIVNTTDGFTKIPCVQPVTEPHQLLDIMYDYHDRMDVLVADMQEAAKTIAETNERAAAKARAKRAKYKSASE